MKINPLWGIIPLLMLTGCMTEATQQRFTAEGANTQTCRMKVLDAKIAIAKFKAQEAAHVQPLKFKSENNALIYGLFKTMGDTNVALINKLGNDQKTDMDTCDDLIVAMVRADSDKVSGINRTTGTALKWVAGLIGLGIISDNWGPSSYGGSGDTWNVEGSRVVNKSGNYGGNASSSGTGLGIGQTYNDGLGQMQGGFQPRQIDNVEATSVSNSGEQLPTNSNNAETPEQLPAE